ncbi:MAG: class I SAM-dependent methyltransferase [Miltoncostaeaceae bacterium]
MAEPPTRCPFCHGPSELAWHYDRPPEGETRFAALEGRPYARDVLRCEVCEHYTSAPPLDPEALYRDAYVDATYGAETMRSTFDRIMGLPFARSDNRHRVKRVVGFADRHLRRPSRRALDIGSGLAVFPAALASAGWSCRALDPDPRAARQARELAGVEAVCADLADVDPEPVFDLVTLNKVLEHVVDPVAMLNRAARFLAPGGIVYIEVPDGPAAASPHGPSREEFFIEHLHAFSPESVGALAAAAGLSVRDSQRLHEPSGKLTISAFLAGAS